MSKPIYILLLKFVTPSGDMSTWESFDNLEAARRSLADHKRLTEQYRDFPMVVAPLLIQHLLIKSEEVQ